MGCLQEHNHSRRKQCYARPVLLADGGVGSLGNHVRATSAQYTGIRLCQCQSLSIHCLRRLTPQAGSNQQDSLLRRVQGEQLLVVTSTERRAIMQSILSALDFRPGDQTEVHHETEGHLVVNGKGQGQPSQAVQRVFFLGTRHRVLLPWQPLSRQHRCLKAK